MGVFLVIVSLITIAVVLLKKSDGPTQPTPYDKLTWAERRKAGKAFKAAGK